MKVRRLNFLFKKSKNTTHERRPPAIGMSQKALQNVTVIECPRKRRKSFAFCIYIQTTLGQHESMKKSRVIKSLGPAADVTLRFVLFAVASCCLSAVDIPSRAAAQRLVHHIKQRIQVHPRDDATMGKGLGFLYASSHTQVCYNSEIY